MIQTTNEITLEMHRVDSRYNRLLSMHNKLKHDSEETIKFLKSRIAQLEKKEFFNEADAKEKSSTETEQVRSYIENRFELNLNIRCRKRELVQARMIYFYLVRKYTSQTLGSMGLSVGLLDHSSVIHALNTIHDLIKYDKVLRNQVEECDNYVKMNIFDKL